ncbi:MAG: ABC transporter ATP-binding protein [Methylotenera sp.]|nr:ABC transporter ATP-binding protein [Methylotenera sp.]
MHLEKTHINPSRRVLELLSLERRDVYIVFFLTLGAGLLAFAIPLAVQALVNVVTMGGVVQPLVVVSLILFILLCLSGTLYLLEYYVVELIQRRVFVRESLHSVRDAQAMSVSISDSHNPIELMNRFFDVTTVQKTSYQLLTKGLAAALQAIVGSLVLMFYSFYFALVSLFLLLMAWVIVVVLGRMAVPSAIHESYAKYNLASWLEGIANNLNIFKFSGGQNLAISQANDLASDYLVRRRKHFGTLFKQNLVAVIVYAVAGSLMLGLGGWLVMEGRINLGQFVAAELIIFGVLGAFLNFVSKLEYFYEMVAAMDKLATIHDMPKERLDGHVVTLESAPELTCMDITFSYSNHHHVLNNVAFSVKPNTSVVILAETGVDRAILADILVGLRNPTSGVVQINGLDLRLLDLGEFRKKVAFANHLEILEGSILDNLRFGNSSNLSEIKAVLESLGLSKRIQELPDGLDTLLVPKGLPLTRIEQRLLMIARAILDKPYLVVIDAILDEVDIHALAIISKALQPTVQPWTLIVLTQSQTVAECFANSVRLGIPQGERT